LLSYYFLLSLPLLCFCVATVAEVRLRPQHTGLILRIAEIAVGIFSVLALPFRFWGIIVASPFILSWVMVSVSVLTGLFAIRSNYASRFALFLVLAGNAILALLWYFNGAFHHWG
jgi:hypothetical protein